MKAETKKIILFSFLAPLIAIVCGAFFVGIAEAWNARFATKEFVSARYMTKEHADKYYFTKAEGDSLKATMCEVKKEVEYIRSDIKLLVQGQMKMNQKLDKYIMSNHRVVEKFTKPPEKPEPPPTAIVGNIK